MAIAKGRATPPLRRGVVSGADEEGIEHAIIELFEREWFVEVARWIALVVGEFG
jgi:hypothetical protein